MKNEPYTRYHVYHLNRVNQNGARVTKRPLTLQMAMKYAVNVECLPGHVATILPKTQAPSKWSAYHMATGLKG